MAHSDTGSRGLRASARSDHPCLASVSACLPDAGFHPPQGGGGSRRIYGLARNCARVSTSRRATCIGTRPLASPDLVPRHTFLLGAYIVAFVLDPAVRRPAETLDHFPWVERGYEIIDKLYPAAAREPAHIIAIGHIQDAYDLRHFITLCLILSLATVFLWTGPGRRECADWLMLKIVRQATTTPQRRFAINSPGGVGVFCLILSSGGLALFDLVGTINGSMNYYWGLEAFPPCLVFQTGAWLFSCGIGLLSLAADASLLQPTVPA